MLSKGSSASSDTEGVMILYETLRTFNCSRMVPLAGRQRFNSSTLDAILANIHRNDVSLRMLKGSVCFKRTCLDKVSSGGKKCVYTYLEYPHSKEEKKPAVIDNAGKKKKKKMNRQIFQYVMGLHWYLLLPGNSHSLVL